MENTRSPDDEDTEPADESEVTTLADLVLSRLARPRATDDDASDPRAELMIERILAAAERRGRSAS